MRVSQALHVALASVFIAVAYELKDTFNWHTPGRAVLLVAGTYVLTGILAAGLADLLLRTSALRYLALNRAFLEGYWLLETYRTGSPTPVSHVIARIDYDGPDLDLKVTSFKTAAPGSSVATASTSRTAWLDPSTLEYLNYFDYQFEATVLAGIADGIFYRDGVRIHPTRYHGTLRYFSGMPDERQVGRKLKTREVRRLVKEHPDDWEARVLAKYTSGRPTP